MNKLLLIISFALLMGCGEDKASNTKVVKNEFSCEKSKKEIDAELKRRETGEITEPEYWQLRQIEYNQKCEKIYSVE